MLWRNKLHEGTSSEQTSLWGLHPRRTLASKGAAESNKRQETGWQPTQHLHQPLQRQQVAFLTGGFVNFLRWGVVCQCGQRHRSLCLERSSFSTGQALVPHRAVVIQGVPLHWPSTTKPPSLPRTLAPWIPGSTVSIGIELPVVSVNDTHDFVNFGVSPFQTPYTENFVAIPISVTFVGTHSSRFENSNDTLNGQPSRVWLAIVQLGICLTNCQAIFVGLAFNVRTTLFME